MKTMNKLIDKAIYKVKRFTAKIIKYVNIVNAVKILVNKMRKKKVNIDVDNEAEQTSEEVKAIVTTSVEPTVEPVSNTISSLYNVEILLDGQEYSYKNCSLVNTEKSKVIEFILEDGSKTISSYEIVNISKVILN